jgi:hypothetical protein
MKLWRTLFIVILFSLIFSISNGMEIPNIGFPFKAFIYQTLQIPMSGVSNITVTKETPTIYEFTYQGKKYRAQLYVYGAIYFEREGQNPLLLCFDIREFRLNGKFKIL